MTRGHPARCRGDRASWNPLSCAGTALAPPLLLAAKLLVVYALASPGLFWSAEIFLPFIEPLDRLHDLVPRAVPRAVFAGAAVALLLNRAVRAAAAACGLVILWGIVASRPAFSNSATLIGCLLLLIGLGEAGRTPWLPRIQVVLVYLGAGMNKLLDPDWTGGAFFEFWTAEILHARAYRTLADGLPAGLLSTAMGWLTIATELGLALGFAWPRLRAPAILAGLGFHLAMLVFTGGAISWVFLYVMGASYLAFASWPSSPLRVWRDPAHGWLRALLAWIDVDRRFEVVNGAPAEGRDGVPIHLEHAGKVRTNAAAVALVLVCSPPTYAVLAGAFFAVRRLISLL